LPDTPNKIAVFIDFDNIEIGVRSTLGQSFDVGVVLEALKERGDVVSKTAYSDWKRAAGDYSRALTQHAIKMVQRNLTPGGDKNGADINLALDALEMAFTHGHINTYVIVGGDSDFISLLEKLKQYDKKVFVVGGRQFTSVIMQKNCHEFIAYENLVGGQARKAAAKGRPAAPIEQVVPLVRRALKLLSEREVSPQLGLLKSTLLQLDSTFSERTYGTGSFRDFAQKLASAGYVTLRESGRNVLVEVAEGAPAEDTSPRAAQGPPQYSRPGRDRREQRAPREQREAAEPVEEAAAEGPEPRMADGIREVRRLFQAAPNPPRWPMYIRQAKQFLRNIDATFDERKFGFASLVDLLRACQREGLFRIERDRQGVMRLFPGNIMQPVAGDVDEDNRGNVAAPVLAAEEVPEPEWAPAAEPSAESEVVDGAVVREVESPVLVDVAAAPETAGGPQAVPSKGRGRGRRQPKAPAPEAVEGEAKPASARRGRKQAEGGAPRARRTAGAPPRTRGRSRAKKEPAAE